MLSHCAKIARPEKKWNETEETYLFCNLRTVYSKTLLLNTYVASEIDCQLQLKTVFRNNSKKENRRKWPISPYFLHFSFFTAVTVATVFFFLFQLQLFLFFQLNHFRVCSTQLAFSVLKIHASPLTVLPLHHVR